MKLINERKTFLGCNKNEWNDIVFITLIIVCISLLSILVDIASKM